MTSKHSTTDRLKNNKTVHHQLASNVNKNINKSKSDQQDELLPPHWTRIASKKHPGKYYYFNPLTKESIWEKPGKTNAIVEENNIIRNIKPIKDKLTSKSEKVIQLKSNPAQFKKKNIAKDRLEKLQKQIESERKQESITKKVISERIKHDNKTTEYSPNKTLNESSPTNEIKPAKKEPPEIHKRKIVGTDNLSESSSSKLKTKIPKNNVIPNNIFPTDNTTNIKQVENVAEHNLEERKSTIQFKSFKIPKKVNKVPVLSSFFEDIKKVTDAKAVNPPSFNTDHTNNLSHKRPILKEQLEAAESCSKIICTEASTLRRSECNFASTPKVQSFIRSDVDSPGFVKSPANDRLSGIRERLSKEVIEKKIVLDDDAEMTDLSYALPEGDRVAEAMDWEDIPEDVAIREVVAVRMLPISTEFDLDETIPGYGAHLFEQTEYQRYILLVIDTNVFLSHLKGVEQMLEKGFPRIGQPVLIVPYIVLQELDRIKHREQGKPLSVAASHSIRFINDHLKRRDPRLKGQSAIEAANQLIPVENADDNLVNCCLQIQQIKDGFPSDLMLLSNDINLRNKALVNGVQACGFTELLAEADRIRKSMESQVAAT